MEPWRCLLWDDSYCFRFALNWGFSAAKFEEHLDCEMAFGLQESSDRRENSYA